MDAIGDVTTAEPAATLCKNGVRYGFCASKHEADCLPRGHLHGHDCFSVRANQHLGCDLRAREAYCSVIGRWTVRRLVAIV